MNLTRDGFLVPQTQSTAVLADPLFPVLLPYLMSHLLHSTPPLTGAPSRNIQLQSYYEGTCGGSDLRHGWGPGVRHERTLHATF